MVKQSVGFAMLETSETQGQFCTKCGSQLPSAANFCRSCGTPRSYSPEETSSLNGTPTVAALAGASGGKPDKTGGRRGRSAGTWILAVCLALVMFEFGVFDDPFRWISSKTSDAAISHPPARLAVVKRRFPPTDYPPQPASYVIEIKSLADQAITVTDIVVNNRLECKGLVFGSFPQKLDTGDTIKVVPSCDPVKVVVSADGGQQTFTWNE